MLTTDRARQTTRRQALPFGVGRLKHKDTKLLKVSDVQNTKQCPSEVMYYYIFDTPYSYQGLNPIPTCISHLRYAPLSLSSTANFLLLSTSSSSQYPSSWTFARFFNPANTAPIPKSVNSPRHSGSRSVLSTSSSTLSSPASSNSFPSDGKLYPNRLFSVPLNCTCAFVRCCPAVDPSSAPRNPRATKKFPSVQLIAPPASAASAHWQAPASRPPRARD